MPPPDNSAPLVFGEFLARLRQQGFTIGVDHHLRLQVLLARVGSRCAPQDLRSLLCPLFATSEREQELFYRAFDDYFTLFNMADERKTERLSSLGAGSSGLPEIERRPPRLSPLLFASLAVLLVALAVFLFRTEAGRRWLGLTQPTPATSPVTPPTITPPPSPTITATATASPSPRTGPEAAAPTPTPQPFSFRRFAAERRAAVRATAGLLPLLAFLLYELWRWRKRQMVLERARRRTPPFAWPLRLTAPELKDYRSEEFYRAARLLRRRQVAEFHRLDIPRTIAATVEARGWPTFRYRPDSRVPEYLVLIERASPRDHWAALADTLVRALKNEGLFVERYFYDGDPRICRNEDAPGGVHLADLQKRYPAHRLLLFGDGERLLDPVTGELTAWASLLFEWPERAVLTPSARFGWRERVLASQFHVVPATLAGLTEVAERFDLPAADFSRRARPRPERPPDTEQPVTVVELQSYLGPEAFQWLCASAVYPELHWELTLHLGTLPCMGRGLVNEANLLRLIRLSWLRAGAMPDKVRLQLIGELEPERAEAVRRALIEILERSPAPDGTYAADARRLEVVVQKAWLGRDDRRKLKQAMQEAAKLPQSEVNREYTLLRLLEDAPTSRLALLLPPHLRKRFYRYGIPGFGLKTGVRAMATAALMLTVWAVAGKLLPVPVVPQQVTAGVAMAIPGALRSFDFTTVTLNSRGEEVRREQKQAQYFVEDLGGGVALEMVAVPGGTFTMGAPEGEAESRDYERPQHPVTVTEFFMGKYEVTRAQWRAVAQLPKVKTDLELEPSNFKGDDRLPVERISWEDAQEFCARLSRKTGRAYRLPSEAEWEYAARAGTTTPFAFGETITPQLVNYDGDYPYASAPKGAYRGKTIPVGSLGVANGFGLYDLHGNVWEWCQDWFSADYYEECRRQGTVSNPQGPGSGTYRVLRGGSWINYGHLCRSALRIDVPPGIQYDFVGLRVVVSARTPGLPEPAQGIAPGVPAGVQCAFR